MTVRPGLFLDRDGVVNRIVVRDGVVSSPWSLDEFEILDGVPGAIDRARAAGFVVVVVTNQPDVARGNLDPDVLAAMHERLLDTTSVVAVEACIHDRQDGCSCRKPRPGMILDAAAELSLDLSRSWMVGDRWVDIAAGRAAGVRTALVRHGDSWAPGGGQHPPEGLTAELEGPDLPSVVDGLLALSDRA